MGERKVYERVRHPHSDEVVTRQAEAAESDVNNIVGRWKATGHFPPFKEGAKFGDFSNPQDLFTALSRVKEAEKTYFELPSEIRKASQNSPVRFLEMLEDPDLRKELAKLGLFEVDPHLEEKKEPPPEKKEPPKEEPAAAGGGTTPQT